MEAVLELIWSLLAGVGVFTLCWLAIGRLLRPAPDPGARVVIPGRGDGEGLEQSVRAFHWLSVRGLLACPVIIADVDLTGEGRALALRVIRRWPEACLWPSGELEDWVVLDDRKAVHQDR